MVLRMRGGIESDVYNVFGLSDGAVRLINSKGG